MKTNPKSVTAVIPAKKNSTRLPGKNTLAFADSNLLVHKIRQLKRVKGIDEILLSTDSDEMIQMALDEGIRAEKRPDDLSDESRPMADFVRYVIPFLHTGHLMWIPVTSPTLDEFFYEDALSKYFASFGSGCDSLVTVMPFQHFLLDKDGPMNFNPDGAVTNSQDLPKWDLYTCGCHIIPVALANEKGYFFTKNAYRYEVTPYQAIDIDNQWDYKLAEMLWKARKNEEI